MVGAAMKVQKTISLGPKQAEKAEQMDNFSEYVRECLDGDLHLKHEALKRQIKHLIQTIKYAKEFGSQHPKFKHACEVMLL
tara:strand:- start:221 stop:463 length:243 start_codon:yes stop_codon:yes gene_type:complete